MLCGLLYSIVFCFFSGRRARMKCRSAADLTFAAAPDASSAHAPPFSAACRASCRAFSFHIFPPRLVFRRRQPVRHPLADAARQLLVGRQLPDETVGQPVAEPLLQVDQPASRELVGMCALLAALLAEHLFDRLLPDEDLLPCGQLRDVGAAPDLYGPPSRRMKSFRAYSRPSSSVTSASRSSPALDPVTFSAVDSSSPAPLASGCWFSDMMNVTPVLCAPQGVMSCGEQVGHLGTWSSVGS